MEFSKVLQYLTQSKDVLCITHTAPDLDGISSMLAFYQAFKDFPFPDGENRNFILLLEEIPRKAYHLPGIEFVKKVEDLTAKISPDLLIVFDAHCPKRVNERVLASFNRPSLAIVFDHHNREDCEAFTDSQLDLVNSSFPSTTALLLDFFNSTKIPFNEEVATLLLFGIYYDTGGFRYENVSAKTFEMASQLAKLGARPGEIARSIFSNRTLGEINLLKAALNRMKFLKDGKVVLTFLTKEDLELYGKELDDLASFFRDVEGVILSILVKELDYYHISVSLRSKPPYPALPLAKAFGGGGHTYACGFRVHSQSLEEVIKLLEAKISQLEI